MTHQNESSKTMNTDAAEHPKDLQQALEDRIDYWQAYKSKLESGFEDPGRPMEDELEAVNEEIGMGMMLYEITEQLGERSDINQGVLHYMSSQYLDSK